MPAPVPGDSASQPAGTTSDLVGRDRSEATYDGPRTVQYARVVRSNRPEGAPGPSWTPTVPVAPAPPAVRSGDRGPVPPRLAGAHRRVWHVRRRRVRVRHRRPCVGGPCRRGG